MRPRTVSHRARRRTRALAFGRTYLAEVQRDRLLGLAAETAFFAVIGIFPGLLVATSLLGLLGNVVGAEVAAGAQDRVVGALQLVLTERASETVSSVESLFEDQRGGLLSIATVGALVTLSGAFAVAVGALNIAYDATETRPWLRRRLLGLGLALGTLVLAVVALAVVVVGPLFGRGEQLADLVGLGSAFTFTWDVLRLPAMVLVLMLWAVTLFHVAPSRRTGWRYAVPGALVTTVLWLLASGGFRLYLDLIAGRNPVLGAFGGGVIVMTWVYLLSLALLLGGELNAVLYDRRHLDDEGRSHDSGEQLPLFA